MVKKICLLSILCAALIVSIQASTKKNQKVDAITSATLHNECKFKVPIAVKTTTATIQWNEEHADQGSAILYYGPNANSLTLSRPVSETERGDGKFVLSGLTGKTSYFLFLKATGQDVDPYGDTATIKTQDPANVLQQSVAAKNTPLELLDHSVKLGSQAKTGDRLAMMDCKGRTLFDRSVSSNDGIISLPQSAKGAYFLVYSRQGKQLDKKLFIETGK